MEFPNNLTPKMVAIQRYFQIGGVQMLMICNGKGITDFIVDKPKKKR